jgi:hypothetical protein
MTSISLEQIDGVTRSSIFGVLAASDWPTGLVLGCRFSGLPCHHRQKLDSTRDQCSPQTKTSIQD